MTREEFAARIEALGRADSRSRARALAADLVPSAGTLDSELRAKLATALELWKLDSTLARVAVSLGVGESWLLLHAGVRDGHVARLIAQRTRPAGADAPGSSATATFLTDSALAAPLRALAGVAARACRRLPSDLRESLAIEVTSSATEAFGVTGRSLDLSGAIAILSLALGRPPAAACAGTALLESDGTLSAVAFLAEKVEALLRDFPTVRMVVVAEKQAIPDLGDRIRFVRARSLEEALASFELDIRDLPASLLDDHVARAASFEQKNKRSHSPNEWRSLSLDAWESCAALAEHHPTEGARCRAWAALFAVHAGDSRQAEVILEGEDARVLEENPDLDAWMLVVRASGSIDRDDLDAAVRQAALAVNKSGALDRGERIRIYGQALGTHGRALMHAGRNVDAEPILREATVHHRAHARTMPTELARSLSYLATCVRRVGRFADALETVEEAIRINTPDALQWAAARVNETYLRLERGRILLAMGNHDEAERALLDVAPHDPITTYPRLGAERSLLTLRLATGHHESAHQAFRRCLEAGRSLLARGETSTHAKVAAVGAAEGMNCLSVTVSERANAEALWTKAFGTQPTDDEIRKVLAMWIF